MDAASPIQSEQKKLLNIRKMFTPDKGHVIIDADLMGADAMVFAWELGDMFGYSRLKDHLRAGVKIHVESNRYTFPTLCGPDGRREPYYTEVKSAFFGTCYSAGIRTLSENLAWPEPRTRQFRNHVFQRFPEIKRYHEELDRRLQLTREVWTRFGYSIHYYGDVRTILPEALAWVPQATIANVCMYGALALEDSYEEKHLRILLQVHDSLVFQIPLYALPILHDVRSILNGITVPYKDPLRIPWSFKWSGKSWGDCEPVDFEKIPGPDSAQVQELAYRIPALYRGQRSTGNISFLDRYKRDRGGTS